MLTLVVVVLLVPVPKLVVRQWSVRVLDTNGSPVSGIQVSLDWENNTFRITGGTESYTDSDGKVVFGNQRSYGPIAYWGAKAISNVVGFGVHAGFGTAARVRISDARLISTIATEQRLLDLSRTNCFNAECTAAPLSSELRVPPLTQNRQR